MNLLSFCASVAIGFCRGSRYVGKVLWRTAMKYGDIDGELRAASFGYYAFFALFPLLLFFISMGTIIWGDKNLAAENVLEFVSQYIPVGPNLQDVVVSTVQGVVNNGVKAGVVALLALAWSSLRFFQALVHGVNRAWGTREYAWWHLPLANFGMMTILAIALLAGVVAPVVLKGIGVYLTTYGVVENETLQSSLRMTRLILPWLVLFGGLMVFYKYAPRRKTLFREVWAGALAVTVLSQLLNKAFVFYAANFSRFNALYGTLGSVVAVLMWIYLSGSLIIIGGCLCAAQSDVLTEGNEEDT